ncbi:DUF1501 domain-containing protein [Verrucomicrobiales bacterium]|nr:DUF1501 domain-containing protein [Verrucomicrobiales bacterium]
MAAAKATTAICERKIAAFSSMEMGASLREEITLNHGTHKCLEQRGLLKDTLVIWGGEFGRLPLTQKSKKPGRDHNPHCFTTWMAGGGIKGGVSYGESDEIGHHAARDKAHVNDIHATILYQLGFNHEKLTCKYNGRRFRLTDVGGKVITPILT